MNMNEYVMECCKLCDCILLDFESIGYVTADSIYCVECKSHADDIVFFSNSLKSSSDSNEMCIDTDELKPIGSNIQSSYNLRMRSNQNKLQPIQQQLPQQEQPQRQRQPRRQTQSLPREKWLVQQEQLELLRIQQQEREQLEIIRRQQLLEQQQQQQQKEEDLIREIQYQQQLNQFRSQQQSQELQRTQKMREIQRQQQEQRQQIEEFQQQISRSSSHNQDRFRSFNTVPIPLIDYSNPINQPNLSSPYISNESPNRTGPAVYTDYTYTKPNNGVNSPLSTSRSLLRISPKQHQYKYGNYGIHPLLINR